MRKVMQWRIPGKIYFASQNLHRTIPLQNQIFPKVFHKAINATPSNSSKFAYTTLTETNCLSLWGKGGDFGFPCVQRFSGRPSTALA